MSLTELFGITTALAAPSSAQSAQGSLWSMLPVLVIFIAVFYFLLIRPQNQRAKEHRQLLSSLAVGDEVVTAGGLVGKVSQLKENFVIVSIAEGVEITLQKSSVASLLPKGTLESAD